MLRAASAFDARVGLQRDELGDIFSGVESEVVIANQGRDFAEGVALQEHGEGTQNQVQMLSMRDQRRENQQGQRMGPPQPAAFLAAWKKSPEVGDHEQENKQGDEARFPG